MLFLGIIGAGGRFTGSNPGYTQSELRHHMQSTRARFLVTEYEFLPVVAQVREYGVPAFKVFALDTHFHSLPKFHTVKRFSCSSIQDLLNHGECDWVRFSSEEEAKNTTAALLSTSGTTGLPKAAMISHHSFVTQSIMLEDGKNKPYKVNLTVRPPNTIPDTNTRSIDISINQSAGVSRLCLPYCTHRAHSRRCTDLHYAPLRTAEVSVNNPPVSDYRDTIGTSDLECAHERGSNHKGTASSTPPGLVCRLSLRREGPRCVLPSFITRCEGGAGLGDDGVWMDHYFPLA